MEKKIRKQVENLSNEELELEFLTTRLRLTQLDDERTRRIRRSTVNFGRDTSRATSPRKLLGVWDYNKNTEIAVGDKAELRTYSKTGKFVGIKKAIVIGLDHRGWVKIQEPGNPENTTTRIPNNLIVKKV